MATEAEQLPFEDESFDLVFGHAVLHHIPDLERAFAEFHRVLRPGGVVAFAGEPSRYGDRLAAVPKRAGMLVAPAWRGAVRASRRAVPEAEQSQRPRPGGRGRRPRLRPRRPAPHTGRDRLRGPPRRRRGAARQRLGLGAAHGRVDRRARLGPVGLAQLRLPQLHRPAEGRHPPARAPPPRRALLQPARLRPQAGLTTAQRSRLAAGAEELDAGVEPLEPALAGEGVLEVLPRRLPRRLVDQHAAGLGDLGDAACQVDRPPVVVAGPDQRRAVGDAGPQTAGTPRPPRPPPRPGAAPRPSAARRRSRPASPRRRSASPAAPAARRPRSPSPRAARRPGPAPRPRSPRRAW